MMLLTSMMQAHRYRPPVDQLLRFGDPRLAAGSRRRDYRALGLDRAHVPELIRLATDETLHRASGAQAEVWGPLHAWRALAQLEAAEAALPLLKLANFLDRQGDDWFLEEFPGVFACFGPSTIPTLAEFLAGTDNESYARIVAAHGLCLIGEQHRESRETVVPHLRDQLARCGDNDAVLNAFLVSYLLQLRAVEAAEVIERAYAAGCVDEGVVGRWDDVRAELGVPGLGLVTKGTPRDSNSLRAIRGMIQRAIEAGSYGEVVQARRRERRKRRRRR